MGKLDKTKAADPAFRIVGIEPGPVHFNGVTIDLSIMTDHELQKCHEQGCSYIYPVTKDASDSEV